MSDFDSRHGSPHHGQNSAEENMMSGSGNQFGVSGVSNPTTAASISHAAVAANPDAAISAAVEDPDAPVFNPTTAASTSHSAAAADPDATISAAVEDPDSPVSNPTTTASTSHSAAAANPEATISAAVENSDAPVSNPTTTASTSHSAAPANPDAPVSAAPAAFSQQHSPSPSPLTSHQPGPSNPTVFGVVVAGAPWHTMWSNEKPSAFERVDATVAPRKKLAWGSGVSKPTTPTSTSHSTVAANSDAPVSAAPAAFSQQHWPHPPPLTSHQQRPSNPTTFELAAAPWRAMSSNQKPSALEKVDATVAPRKKLVWGSGVSKPTTPTSTSHSTVAANTDAPVSAAPAAFSQQHWPHPSPLTSHQQRPVNRTALEGALRAPPWRAMWGSEKPSALERVDAAVAPRKKLPLGVQGTNGTEKSPGFRMRVDSDDGISDDEGGSAVAPGPGGNRKRVAIDDVIKRTTEYFESNITVSGLGSLQVKSSFSLKKLRECEIWVTSQFSAQQFSALGHGTFLEFLERHGHHFPPNWSGFLRGELPSSSSLEVSVVQQQIGVLLCQAESNWLENGEFSVDSFRMLLKRQFPTVDVEVMQNKLGGLNGTTEVHRKIIQTSTIKFSIALLEKRWSGIFLGNAGELLNDIAQQSYPGSVSSQEAIKCLLKAPLLSDLLLWSNWDVLFAPSLGSFTHWLLNIGPIQDLSCIVTTDGRFVRIDTSATVDQFLEAIIQQSPFQVAVKLLSLLHIYNGSSNAPISLLKCYAQRAVDAIMNTNNVLISTSSEGKIFVGEELHTQIAEQGARSSHYIGRIQGSSEIPCVRRLMSKSLSNIDHTLQLIAKFIVDCLGHLPSEFRILAADILLSGLQTVTKNCYSAILHACSETWQLCMLHNIGLSLGVAEWVEDHDTTCLTEDIHAHGEINSSSVPGGHPHENTSMLNDAADDTIKERSKSFHGLEATNNENMDVFDPIEIEADMAELLATNKPAVIEELTLEEAALIIETIRHEEFGLEQTQSYTDDSLLKKQHARLGRALHCLSQELYSQDSHIILELIQNADDNTYIKDVEPTLAFVLQENGIAILNNEKGFCADNIRALCDIGNSTKKGSNMGYIGNKGIGFKSVFRVTDAPEIHSNSFHVKFDITEGQIGFILPTAIPPLDRDPLSRLLSSEDGFDGCSFWNTCILLPFRSSVRKGTDGSFSSIADGPIWLNYDLLDSPSESKISMQSFPVLYNNLRIVSPHILSMSCKNSYIKEEMKTDDLIDILLKIGVQKLSGHDIIKNHILVSLSNATDANAEEKIITEYLSFIMLHLQSSCTSCDSGKEEIVSKLRKRPVLLTNNGYKCPADVPIHFSKHYGNSVDIGKLLQNVDTTWIELDTCYLRHHSSASLQFKLKSWRQFFEELGVTDFVQVVKVEKSISEVDYVLDCTPSQDVISGTPCIVYDWESPELANLLSIFSSKKYRENSIYLLKVLDKTWDDYYSTKSRSLRNATHSGENVTIESSFMKCLRNFKWIASSMDDDLHYARDLFCDLANVRSLLGSVAPYAKPVLSSKSLPKDIGFKTKVSYSDALLILNHWISSKGPFKARMNQMCKLYTFLSEGAANGEINIKRDFLSLCFIFTPVQCSRPTDLVTGRFMSSKDLYWHDPTGSSEMTDAFVSVKRTMLPRRMLSMAYPRLHEFFTEICGVPKIPTTSDYLEILLQLSSVALPSQVANYVFHVFVRWANDLHSGSDKMKDIFYLKESLQKLETTILPTLVDKWVSLHPSFGLVCWADDDQLKQQFTNSSAIEFIQFGELSLDDKQMLCARVAALMDILGIPALSKVVYREAIFYGTGNNRERASFISWLLPYMQRYIYKMHRDTYNSFQQKETMKLSSLEVIVVQKLFFKYMLKGCDSSSKRRFECHCLLQGNILYATQEADSHSVLFELSRLFFGGSGDLHFANFLHMVKTMSESGSTMDQIEFFIVNNQMVPVLPEQESVWSFSSSFVAKEIFTSQTVELQPPYEPSHTLKRKRSPEIISSQPPSKKTGPDLTTSNKSQQEIKVNDMTSLPQLSKPVECGHTEDTSVPVKLEGDHVVKDDLAKENNMLAKKSTTEIGDEPTCLDLEAAISPSPVDETELTDIDEKLADTAEEEDSTDTGSPCGGKLGGDTPGEATVPKPDERSKTGRLGEAVVHQYLVGQLGSSNVKWVNQESETGLPYDIVITPEGGSAEYVEVKATVISNKEWFYVSPREWQFALEKGESFSIAHVLLAGSDKAKIVMLKNPQKLCRQQKVDLNLALVMTRKHRNLHQISVELKPDTISLTDESAS
ncbi:hypothetical protein ACQ4PT_020148 [Festuca glaucescens]